MDRQRARAAQCDRARGDRGSRPADPARALPWGSGDADRRRSEQKQDRIDADLSAWARRAFRERSEGDQTVYERFLELAEPPLLRAVLEECGNNRAAAAQILGIHRATLRQKLRKYGIE